MVVKLSSKSTRAIAPRDAELTRAAILDAAEEEFAKSGLAGARTDAIAARTGVTKAMIYYYFSGKEELYQAVLDRAFGSRIEDIKNIVDTVDEPEEALKQVLGYFLSRAQHNPNFSGIMFHEAMQNKGKFYKETGLPTLYQKVAEVLQRGIESGVFRPLDAMHTAVNIVGLSAFYFCAHENLKHLWPGQLMLGQEMVEQHKDEAMKLIMIGVRAT